MVLVKRSAIIFFFLLAISSFCFGLGEQIVKKSCLGSVSSMNIEQMNVRTYDLDNGEYIEKIFIINKNPTLRNISNLQDIKVGDNVNIEYYLKDKKNIVISIFLEKISEEEKVFQQVHSTGEKSEIMEEYTSEEMNAPEKEQ